MTVSGKRDMRPRCPRCGQVVEIGAVLLQIKPHRDNLVKTACPTAGMDMRQATHWVEDARRRIREMAQ